MGGIVIYVIWAALIISGLSLLAMLLFGVRSVLFGKLDYVTMGILAVPVLLFVVLGLSMDTWAEAAVMTFLAMLALTTLSLFLSSVRGLLGM